MPRRLSHLGPRGTYTEAAAIAFDAEAELIPCPTVAAAVEAVEAATADAAVCAIENSIEGSVRETVDLLIRPGTTLLVQGELVLPIRHALVGAAGVDPMRAAVVYSHPQALAQCGRRLAELAPDAKPVAALSTAAAIESAVGEPGALAVGNVLAAAFYGGTVYEDDIADEPGNVTRFVMLARDDHEPTGDDKTSLAFTANHDRPGTLVEVLNVFSSRAINLTHVESRPTRRALGTYVFLLDFQGHREDAIVVEALREVERVALWMRVIGSYPRRSTPIEIPSPTGAA